MDFNFEGMSREDLEKLKRALDELGRSDPDRGRELHLRHNSVVVSGPFSEMTFPPYEYKAWPKHLYTASGDVVLCNGPEDAERAARTRGRLFESPTEAETYRKQVEEERANVAAALNYEDRHLSPAAKRERDRADEEAEDHLVTVPETPIRRATAVEPQPSTASRPVTGPVPQKDKRDAANSKKRMMG